MLGTAEVGNLNTRRIDLSAGTADCDNALLVTSAVGNQTCLGAKAVNAVNDVIEFFCHQGFEIFNGEKFFYGVDLAMRIDLLNAPGHYLHLGHTEGVGQGMQLPVDVGFGNVVKIDQCDIPDGTACQCLDCPGANTANTQHADMCLRESRQCLLAVESADAGEAAFKIDAAGSHFRVGCTHVRKHTRKRLCLSVPCTYNVINGTD